MVNYQDLYFFVIAVEKGSLVSAARYLNVPLSTLSRRIQAFEDRLGYKLIHRTAKHFGLTESGMRLYEGVNPMIHDLELQVENINSELSSLTGELKITAPIALGHHFIQPLVRDFMRENPRISVELQLSNDNADLVKNSIDIAFRMGVITLNEWISRPLFKTRSVLCASPSHLDGLDTIDSPGELGNWPLVATRGTPVWRFQQGEDSVSFVPRPVLTTNEARLALEMVLDGMGIGYLPSYMVEQYLARGELVALLADWNAGDKDVHMIYPHRSSLPARTRAFIDYVIEHFPKHELEQPRAVA
ncbi:LysR family transcriptional regulator [Oceanobacter mangrovi]|uniref:LysR family transcriptional regulator n=1 Tax=Oceanobacter mangrovi TaxID=2862510 RepID=UPI001C8E3B9F|nr:LysR family transcriptional regulator [Oceanobacter mangrovi]